MVQEQNRKWFTFLIIAVLLLFWEVFHSLGLIDPVRFSHPVAVFQVLGQIDFLRGFGMMLLQLTSVSLVGGVIGVSLGGIITHSTWLTQSTIRFLRTALWSPFIIMWALPVWPPRNGCLEETLIGVLIVSNTTVALSASYHYLITRSTLGLQWREARSYVARTTFLQALFISLISQMWLSPYGWEWYFFGGPTVFVAGLYASLILLLLLLFIVDRLFRLGFDQMATVRRNFLVRETAYRDWSLLLGYGLFAVVSIITWQILSWSGLDSILSFPIIVLEVTLRMFSQGTVWRHVYVSLLEVFGGLILGVGLALVVYRILLINTAFKNRAFLILPLMYVTPIVLTVFLIVWLGNVGYWNKTGGVALVSFFPFIQAIWALRDYTLPLRILTAVDDALPFAFITMLFGEAVGAVEGLGFLMVMAHVRPQTVAEGLAVALVLLALLIIISSALQWTVNHLYFRGA